MPNKHAIANQQAEDHDLLVTLSTKFDAMAEDIREIKGGTAVRLAQIEVEIKSNSKRIDAIDKRVESWETSMKAVRWTLGLIASVIAFVIANLSGAFDLLRK